MIRTAKKVIVLLCWILIFAGMSGCLSGEAQEERISVAFQVVAFDKAPQKLQDIIEAHKKEEIKMTWEGDEGRYIIRGYGEQPTGGYSIRADAVELMGDGLHVTTTLIPPQKEQAAAEASYPCIILLIENMDQEVTFEP